MTSYFPQRRGEGVLPSNLPPHRGYATGVRIEARIRDTHPPEKLLSKNKETMRAISQ